jgi:hypothetical protein
VTPRLTWASHRTRPSHRLRIVSDRRGWQREGGSCSIPTGRWSAALRQSTSVDAFHEQLSTDVDTALVDLRAAVSAYTLDALEAFMYLDKSLISRVLNGERPLTQKFISALPDDAEAKFQAMRAQRFGLVVVEVASPENAAQQLAAGLIGLLRCLPAKAGPMLKADLAPRAQKVTA